MDVTDVSIQLPKLPKSIISEFGYALKSSIDHQIVSLVENAISCDKARDDSFKQTRALFTNTNRIAFGIRTGFFDNMENHINENESIIRQVHIKICCNTLMQISILFSCCYFLFNKFCMPLVDLSF